MVLPGGFAHGDYLRPGALARFSPVMGRWPVRRGRGAGGGHLQRVPGADRGRSAARGAAEEPRPALPVHPVDAPGGDRRARCSPAGLDVGHRLTIPINHFAGSYVCDAETLAELRGEDRVVLRYADNPNGSIDDIAGV